MNKISCVLGFVLDEENMQIHKTHLLSGSRQQLG